jgi:hypothetical protein
MDEQQQQTDTPPEPPVPMTKAYVYIGGSMVPVLETYDEITALLEDAEPGAFIEFTVGVQQQELHNVHPVIAALTSRHGFTRARYRESYVTGYIEVLPPEIQHDE